MKQVYFQQGRTFKPADPSAMNIQDKLPPGTYTIGVSPAGFHLEKVEDFVLPSKLYGNVEQQTDRILRTFLDRPSSTGVLLSGQKGAGKTMLTKRISQRAMREHDCITILINQALCGEAFNSFIQSIDQPAIVLFDEFEKVYDRDDQTRLLTIFDGVYPSKKLFLLTCNDRFRIDTYMHNRPGRLYYSLDFGGLDKQFITDYCQDNLKDLARMNGVVAASAFFTEFSFDMLKALVEEMNRYGETATEAMKMLNMKPQNDSDGLFEVEVVRNGKPVLSYGRSDDTTHRSPLSLNGWNLHLYGRDDDEAEIPGAITEPENYKLEVEKLISVDAITGSFTFGTHRPDTTLHFKRRIAYKPTFDYEAY